jgi:hypothetical protein
MSRAEDDLRARVDRERARNGNTAFKKQESASLPEPETFTAEDLRLETFPPQSWFLPDIVPSEGVTLLCSKPKYGKSWFALDAAIAATANRYTLGEIKPDQGDVLYLALEDSRRRLQRRITKLLPTFKAEWPAGLTIATKWRRLHEGGLEDIRAWYQRTKDNGGKPVAVIIDVLAKIRKPTGNRQAYEADYEALTGLCELANGLGIAVIVIHHVRKMAADDLMETISGSFGIAGSADTLLVMAPGKTGGAVLDIRGRDVESAELAIQFSKESCKWTILGTAAEVHQTDQRKAIIAALAEHGAAMKITELMAATNMKRNPLDLLLGKMVRGGLIKRVGVGLYALADYTPPPEPQPSVRSVRPQTDDRQKPDRQQATDKTQESTSICPSVPSVRVFPDSAPRPEAAPQPDLSANTQTDQTDQTDRDDKSLGSLGNSWHGHLSTPQTDRTDQTNQTDDLPLPAFLDRRNDPVCAYCGRPGGRQVACNGLMATVHEECERGWLTQLDQKSWATAGSSQ